MVPFSVQSRERSRRYQIVITNTDPLVSYSAVLLSRTVFKLGGSWAVFRELVSHSRKFKFSCRGIPQLTRKSSLRIIRLTKTKRVDLQVETRLTEYEYRFAMQKLTGIRTMTILSMLRLILSPLPPNLTIL